MDDRGPRESSGTTAVVIVVAVLLLGLPCLGVVGLFVARVLFDIARVVPTEAEPEPVMQATEPPLVEPLTPVESAVSAEEGK